MRMSPLFACFGQPLHVFLLACFMPKWFQTLPGTLCYDRRCLDMAFIEHGLLLKRGLSS
ncbi:hypothetical protein NEUTE1DRAFT_97473 [Neurospora tetrasperma FGSC 2508]|uniref:Uncharacterized protein n=1 Tax=Neurospora tetrasperma (strain FGSC 2508 / ATCC MYA-4615 / P0657) TaxID=510951 RepID=F8MBH7_NEUT8|nr:uncharacterized protein NEUTE1DRAFT_97473 [Neurospora tetrasperma FGSC 2508]EGO60289.1 hypothetical protein NEUTE1DRAFT_97473 [Neurospora tetrasperma FGSC 2508]EGZ75747.1 hypothetical protein NEUTE2DRAFT_56153 [Neurospora tetrasperma FGSC 2509]